jgi:hypothetical protein
MDTLSLIVHLANFLFPAVFMAAGLWALSRILWRHKPAMFKPWLQFVLISVAGAGVLIVGLVWGGQDGKMLTYTGLVVVSATLQWVFLKAWRG